MSAHGICFVINLHTLKVCTSNSHKLPPWTGEVMGWPVSCHLENVDADTMNEHPQVMTVLYKSLL